MRNPSEIRAWTIYKITNPIGQVYIGCTNSFNKRILSYKRKLSCVKKQRLLYQSLEKYDFYQHNIVVLDEFSNSYLYAQGKEMFWIKTYMCNSNKWPDQNGLNLTDGGSGNIGSKLSKEHKEFLASLQRGKKRSPEHIERMRQANKGNKYTLGIKSTPEAIIARRIARNKMCRPVVQYNINGDFIKEFISVNEASKEIVMDKSNIYGVLCGILKSSRGFTFKYK